MCLKEKEQCILQAGQDHCAALNELRVEMENFQSKAEREKTNLINEVACVQKERDDLLMEAESDKQEELRIAASEKGLLVEKLNRLAEELDDAKIELEKFKREATQRAYQEKVCRVFFSYTKNVLRIGANVYG